MRLAAVSQDTWRAGRISPSLDGNVLEVNGFDRIVKYRFSAHFTSDIEKYIKSESERRQKRT